jgi:hypothetical protein
MEAVSVKTDTGAGLRVKGACEGFPYVIPSDLPEMYFEMSCCEFASLLRSKSDPVLESALFGLRPLKPVATQGGYNSMNFVEPDGAS